MKIQAGRADSFAKNPDAGMRAVLVYGPDAGLVRERVQTLTLGILEDPNDPFRLAELVPDTIKQDPARLLDEATAQALTGGRRVLRIRDSGDGLTKILEAFLADYTGDTLVLLAAGDLGPRSSLRKLFEGAKHAAALPCYPDDARALDQVLRDTLKTAGLSIDREALAWLLDHLGGDRGTSRRELEKLVTYMGKDRGTVTTNDVLACIGDTAALTLDSLTFAAADGDHKSVQRIYARLTSEGTSPVSVLTASARHMVRLHQTLGHTKDGLSIDQALAKLKPPVFFKNKLRFKSQVVVWTLPLLTRALALLSKAEIAAKTTGMPAEAIAERTLLQLAAAVRNRQR